MRQPEPPTKNPIAYELYLRAADRLFRLNSWDNRAAVDMLENATKLDPKFADAWARLAEALMLVGTTSSASPHWVRDAEAALRKAIALDPDNAEAHCAKGRILWSPAKKFQNGPALRALSRALRLNPGCQPARVWQALIFNHIGMLKEAKEGLLLALASRPDDAFTNVFLGHTALNSWNFEEAEECLQRALRDDPVNIWANVFQPTVFIYAGKLNEADASIRAAQNALPEDPWLHSCEALLVGSARRTDQGGDAQCIWRCMARPSRCCIRITCGTPWRQRSRCSENTRRPSSCSRRLEDSACPIANCSATINFCSR